MINLIQHLWQLEIPQCKITPTIIKITNQPPKLYFYSEKQSRVLRKKQHSVQTCINYFKQSNKKDEQYLLMKIQKSKHIVPSLIMLNQVSELIEKKYQSLSLLAIESNSKIQKIFLCECNFIENRFETKILMRKDHGIWSCKQNMIQTKDDSKIIKECLKMCNTLLLKLKITKKCNEFNVIVGTDSSSADIFWLWCNTFKWNQQSFYQIDFGFQEVKLQQQCIQSKGKQNYLSNNQSTSKKQDVKNIKDSSSQSPLLMEKTFNNEKVTDQQNRQLEKCIGCQKKTDKNTNKQVSFDDIISLRRHKKLSIKGISDQFAPVCHACYTLLEQLEIMA